MKTRQTAIGHRAEPEWFAAWFDSTHYQTLYAHRNDEEAAGFVDQLAARLRPAAGATVLDLGCGTGRHARHLNARGLRVVGIDLSSESIRRAKEFETPDLWFRRQDMRLPFGHEVFDYVVNLFTSFGYFDDPSDDVAVIHNIARALKPGGVLVLDYLNVSYAERHLTPEEDLTRNEMTYRIARWTDVDHIFKRILVNSGGTVPREYVERVAKLTLQDFVFMFLLCDIELEAIYGNYRLEPFDVDTSPRLILVAKKPSRPARISDATGSCECG